MLLRRAIETEGNGDENGGLAWAVLAVLMLGALLHRLAHWDHFVVPSPDFYQYRNVAAHVFTLELPEGPIRVLPGLPMLLGVLGSVIPGPRPFLHAGQAVSLVASLSLFPLLWLPPARWAALALATLGAGLHVPSTAHALQRTKQTRHLAMIPIFFFRGFAWAMGAVWGLLAFWLGSAAAEAPRANGPSDAAAQSDASYTGEVK